MVGRAKVGRVSPKHAFQKCDRIFETQNLMIALQSSKATFGEGRPT